MNRSCAPFNVNAMEDDKDPILSNSTGNVSYGASANETPSETSDSVGEVENFETRPQLRSPFYWSLSRSLSNAGATYIHSGSTKERRAAGSARRTLGTFAGVFCPIALSMFSTLLFLRGGFVVGQAGILETIAQLILAYMILVLTVLSICAISTNGAVEGGGAYYMISRALGPEFGGSIGFLFFVANVMACALYISGFVEGILQNFGPGGSLIGDDSSGLPDDNAWWKYLYATIVSIVCLLVCLVGGAMFARTSAFILLIVVICLLSVVISIFAFNHRIDVRIPFTNKVVYTNMSEAQANITGNYTGLNAATFRENLFANYTVDYNTGDNMQFATVFAILFSSVTGILNGANMSGELKDPSKSIPKGTLSAVGFTFIAYMILSILIGGSCSRFLLKNDYVFLQQINGWPPFVVVGIFAATLSAALGNLIGASRILEALGVDQLFWIFLKPATITTKGGNPFMAVIISWVLVQCILLIGSLNAIAPVTSVFFLMSYAATNLACLALELASAPNFRPTFRYFTWYTCGLGLVGCMVMCFLISPIYTSIALVIMLMLVILLHFRSLPTSWGSISQALIFHQVRKYLLMLDSRKAHVKYWRPQILLMVANPRQCCELMDFINDIKKSGLYVIGHVKVGRLEDYPTDPILDSQSHWLSLIDHLKIKAFAELTLANSVREGLQHLVRVSGLGGMKPNTVCLGFYDSSEPQDTLLKTKVRRRRFFGNVEVGSFNQIEGYFGGPRDGSSPRNILSETEYVNMIKDCIKLGKNLCLCRHFNQMNKMEILESDLESYVDVWPVNLLRPETASYFDNTCLFLLQLACILNMVPRWKSKTTLRVFLMVNAQTDNTIQKEQKLDMFLRQLRIIAKIQVISWDHLQPYMRSPYIELDYDGSQMQDYYEAPDDFVKAMNELIIANSSRTAASFLYLPKPPTESALYGKYLYHLDMLTANLKPTILVQGLHPVTSTTL
ncbi:solute carrier family 12 member 9-like isoform X1 [Haliotis rufescens]|uniref:solute carrier family 12 member 9-like isoform X1 n=1 Tax=Haliotis rufescens TaxID=6454 RepID=UPI001EB0A326|nr:solute carrier family 12 member 9-like isoform X1 [Haliotis rufescens]